MSRTNLTTEVCDGPDIDNLNIGYNVRTILFLLTNLLSPCYILLSLVAVLSRRNNILKTLASHGKTSTNDDIQNLNNSIGGSEQSSKISSLSWSRLSRFWISKQCFVHFYLVGLVSTGIATIYHFTVSYERILHDRIATRILDETNLIRTVAIVLLVIHVTRRACECLFVQQYRSGSSKMNIMAYLLGVGHYTVLPLVFWDIDAINSGVDIISDINSNNEIDSFGSRIIYSTTNTTTEMRIFILTMIGTNLWLQYEQYTHHVILADIRRVDLIETKRDDDLRRNQHYSHPPYQRWFQYVLSPHYLAEIILYLFFAIMLEMATAVSAENTTECKNIGSNNFENLPFSGRVIYSIVLGRRYRHWTLFGWVTTNLTVSAMNSYDWYNKSHQPADCRRERRALIPKIL